MIAATLFSSFVVCFLIYLYALRIFIVVTNNLFEKKSVTSSSLCRLVLYWKRQSLINRSCSAPWDQPGMKGLRSAHLFSGCAFCLLLCVAFCYLVCMAALKCLNFTKNLSLTCLWHFPCSILVLYL